MGGSENRTFHHLRRGLKGRHRQLTKVPSLKTKQFNHKKKLLKSYGYYKGGSGGGVKCFFVLRKERKVLIF